MDWMMENAGLYSKLKEKAQHREEWTFGPAGSLNTRLLMKIILLCHSGVTSGVEGWL